MGKRSRACEECHRLKIKCDASISLGGSCERCSRNKVACVPAMPRLQRNRINELEAQLQELRNALQDHSSSSTTPTRSPANLSEDHGHTVLSFLDNRISLKKQQDLLGVFAHHAGAAWPIVSPPLNLDRTRADSPILLLSLLVYSVTQNTQGTDMEVHDELLRETMHVLGREVIGKGEKTIELVQALLVATFWAKTARKGQQGTCYQILQLAIDMAIDLGIAGTELQPSPVAYFCRLEDPLSYDARRTWLSCFVASSISSINTRRPNVISWNAHHQECLISLERRGDPSDTLLCQFVRIAQVVQEISDHLRLCEMATFIDGNSFSTYAAVGTLKSRVDAWAAQIPSSHAPSQTLKLWWHVAMIYIHELVLHTPTNKASFAAPFVPERIPIKDFPKPTHIIPPLESALGVIIQNCHAVINTATEMDPSLVLSLPSFFFAPAVIYSLFVLVIVVVATADPENTYGQCLKKENCHIERCGFKLRTLTANLKTLDPTLSSYTTRLFDATGLLEEWYNDYTALLRRYEANLIN